MKRVIFKGFKMIGLALAGLLATFLLAHVVGRAVNSRTPAGGINESMYVTVNGTKQWIAIYGEDRDNPVLLYLHGGPGSSTSDIDYAFTRKWADVYTVVTWDQRNCGKSYSREYDGTALTREMLMEDGRELTLFLMDYLGKDRITLLGHSWGSIYGANLAQAWPQYYDCFIGTGQLVDSTENEAAFKAVAAEWAAGDAEAEALVEQLTPGNITMAHITARNALMEKYGVSMMRDGADYDLFTTILFNPYYSLGDWIGYFGRNSADYLAFFASEEFESFSIQGKYDYAVPYYNINGDEDYQTYYVLAQEYFDRVSAPDKQMYIMENTTHGLLESKSALFSGYVHAIAERRKQSVS